MESVKRIYSAGLGTDRVEAFSDGVFAVAITLLVFAINPPVIPAGVLGDGGLGAAIFALWPKVLSYVISFSVIGIFWIGHHIMFHYIKRSDRLFVWLNNIFLMSICFIPFSAALIGDYPREQISVIVYGATLVMAGLLFWILWQYASWKHRLIADGMGDDLVRLASKVVLLAPIAYMVGVLLSYIDPLWSIAFYVIFPLVYILPGPIDRLAVSAEEYKSRS